MTVLTRALVAALACTAPLGLAGCSALEKVGGSSSSAPGTAVDTHHVPTTTATPDPGGTDPLGTPPGGVPEPGLSSVGPEEGTTAEPSVAPVATPSVEPTTPSATAAPKQFVAASGAFSLKLPADIKPLKGFGGAPLKEEMGAGSADGRWTLYVLSMASTAPIEEHAQATCKGGVDATVKAGGTATMTRDRATRIGGDKAVGCLLPVTYKDGTPGTAWAYLVDHGKRRYMLSLEVTGLRTTQATAVRDGMLDTWAWRR